MPQPASWIAATEGSLALALREVWPRCCDADTGWAWGEHSAPDVVREVPGTDVFDILMEEPRTCLALDIEVRQACETPEPAKSVQILFRGEHGLGVWKLAAEQSLADWYSGERHVGDLGGYFATIGGKILYSGRKVGSLGLGHMAEVVFRRRLLGGSLVAWSKAVAFR